MASFLGRVAESIFNQLLKEGIKRVFGHREKKNERKKGSKEETDKQKQKTVSESNGKKIHPWRLCQGELRDHLIEMSVEESREPEINIAAGIRWLHHKKRLAEHRLKREVTWEEAGAEYKGILPDLEKNEKSKRIMRKLTELYQSLKAQRAQGS